MSKEIRENKAGYKTFIHFHFNAMQWRTKSTKHTASFWNITIQWTSHDDLTDFFLCLSILNTNWKNSWNQSVKKVNWKDLTEIFCACFKKCLQNLLIYLEAKSMHGSSWIFFSIISVFILVFADQVVSTVNGLL